MEWINEGIEMDKNEEVTPMCGLILSAAGGVAVCMATGALCDNLCTIQFG